MHWYNLTGPDKMIRISDTPLTYKTKRTGSLDRFIRFMEQRGYRYLPEERMGAMLYFEDAKAVRLEVLCGMEDYYMAFAFVERNPASKTNASALSVDHLD